MISLATVACSEDGDMLDEFEINLQPLADATQDPDTMDFWATEPDAWAYSTANPMPPEDSMVSYSKWVKQFSGIKVFAAHPASFDLMWVTWYLQVFVGDKVFEGPGLDISSYVMATLGCSFLEAQRKNWPDSWLGGFTHTHRAIDDARGYAAAFFEAARWNIKLNREDPEFKSLKAQFINR